MNHQLWTKAAARVIALAFVIAGASACHDRLSDVSSATPAQPATTGSAQVVGTAPAEPSGDPPGTSPVAANTSDLTKKEESRSGPMEGQDSSHLTESRKDSQRSGADGDQQTERRAK